MTRRILIAFCCACAPFALLAQEEIPKVLTESITQFEQSRDRIREKFAEQEDLLKLRYAQELEAARQQATQAGDLDGVLIITEEQRRARAGEALSALDPDKAPAALRTARGNLGEATQRLRAQHLQQESSLTDQYLQHLLALQRRLTIENEIDAALAVRSEHQRRVAERELAAVAGPGRPFAEGSAAPFLAIRGHRGTRPPGRLDVQFNQAVSSLPLEAGDPNRVTPRGLELQGGTTELTDLPKEVLEAFRTANEFSLVAHLQTRQADQRGPARIVSYSRDPHNRNFTLGQDGDQLVLRLRTTQTGPNGESLDLGAIRVQAVNRVVFTYKPGEARLYRDGREIDVRNLNGDLSNWEEAFLIFGNEKTGDRAWQGRLEAVQIINRVLPPAEAMRLSAGPLH